MKKYCEPDLAVISFVSDDVVCDGSLTGEGSMDATIPEGWDYGD